ncbi:hypothetical protein LHJ74_22720 [Streptomyces sp. N2-109]|uniref:Uncharacterized protein n=1 Tax=Streptomyces gossypii TaxID=2883101 RepID=A0ABT2JY87_9ACTN|nr:hypothetical protein [Streptomyces gossypii]MCT2592691.1 hypothetical protein [Streptomyces gossypii]
MSADAPLTRASFLRLTPVRAPAPLRLLPDRLWTDEEWSRIRQGLRARSMDEKWHVFTEGDVAFLHRSWTGNGIYEVTFAPSPAPDTGSGTDPGTASAGDRRVVSATVETDPERYRSRGGEFESLMIELILGSIVLGDPAPELWARHAELLAVPPQDGEREG